MHAVGAPLTIEDVSVADPGPREVLIEVAGAGLCHSDLHFIDGSYPLDLPAILGHESAGMVVGVGDDVTQVAPGDHVITSLSVFCGGCHFCLSGRSHLCDWRQTTQRRADEQPRLTAGGEEVHQFLNLSSFAELMLVHENAVVRITEEMPLEVAALLGCGVATGLGAVFNTAGVRPGEVVAVIGCGGVGLSAVQGARIAGAGAVIAVDVVEEKLAMARSLGATHLVNPAAGDVVDGVIDLTGGLGVDHAIEAVGSASTVEAAFAMLRRGGTATVVGLIPPGNRISLPADGFYWEKKLQGSVMGSNRFRIDTPRYVGMYLDGRLNLDDMVTERLQLDRINEGFAAMRTGRVARSLIVFDQPR